MNLRVTARLLSAGNLAASIRSQEVTVRSLAGIVRQAVDQERQAQEILNILQAEQVRRETWARVRAKRHSGRKS